MKFSPASLLLLVSFAASVVATGATTVAPPVPEPSSLDHHEQDVGQVQAWHEIFSRLRVGFRGMRKRPGQKDIAFLVQAIKRAYNIVHAPLGDDYMFLDFNVTSIEMEADDAFVMEEESSNTNSLLDWLLTTGSDEDDNVVGESLGGRRKRSRRRNRTWGVSSYGISGVGCNLCGDDRLALPSPTTRSSLQVTHGLPPFANLQPIEALLCKILNEEGSDKVFGKIKGCTIFEIEPVRSWTFENEKAGADYEQVNTSTSTTPTKTLAKTPPDHDLTVSTEDSSSSKMSIALAGLSCDEKHDFLSCQEDALHQLVSDALVIAYNQVNFGDDYFIQDFVPTSLELYREEQHVDPSTAAATLRGGAQGTAATNSGRPTGTWYGSVRVQCRTTACEEKADHGEADEEVDPILAPFLNLKEVERVFCGLMSDAGDQSDALTALEACSLSVVQKMVAAEESELTPSFLLESN
jgi:hypothetical protein